MRTLAHPTQLHMMPQVGQLEDRYQAARERIETERRSGEAARREQDEWKLALPQIEKELAEDIQTFLKAMKRAKNPGLQKRNTSRGDQFWVLVMGSHKNRDGNGVDRIPVGLDRKGRLRWIGHYGDTWTVESKSPFYATPPTRDEVLSALARVLAQNHVPL